MKKTLLALAAVSTLVCAQDVQNSTINDIVDMSSYQAIQKKETKIVFDSNSSDVEGIYNYKYSPNAKLNKDESNIFLEGYFETIHRYDSLYFNGASLDGDSEKVFDAITKQIHKYRDDESREIVVSVLGFTQKIENPNEEIGTDTAYTNFFQNIAKRDNLDSDSASDEALNFMEIVYEKMLDDNISKEIIYKENRVGKDALFTEEFSDGRAKNNRVDVAIYVKEILDPDTDGDGVHDSKDFCPKTPLGASVDKNGCPLIMSLDLLFDFDKATISDDESLKNVKKLSAFMKKYPVYHANIVGHTDSSGSQEYNQKLSLRRAQVVKKLIVEDGVDASRLGYEGRGESEPLFENINPFNRHQNRRTEVELTLPSPEAKRTKIVPRSRGFEE